MDDLAMHLARYALCERQTVHSRHHGRRQHGFDEGYWSRPLAVPADAHGPGLGERSTESVEGSQLALQTHNGEEVHQPSQID